MHHGEYCTGAPSGASLVKIALAPMADTVSASDAPTIRLMVFFVRFMRDPLLS